MYILDVSFFFAFEEQFFSVTDNYEYQIWLQYI